MDLDKIKEQLSIIKQGYNRELGIKTRLEGEKKANLDTLKRFEEENELYEKKKLLLKESSEEARKLSRDLFALLSSYGLKHILGPNLSVKINLGESGGSPVADFLVHSQYEDYEVEVDPTEEEGGGVADIVALASFFNLSNFHKNRNTAPFFLDEPTKFVSKGHAKDVASFISSISKDIDKQVIMVTHDQVSKEVADKAYHFKLDDNGKSVVEDITKETEFEDGKDTKE